MPYYGRPSNSCQSCRERRIKCDRLEPICSQCKRAGHACGGYRDVPSFMFRNENDKTALRSAIAKARSAARQKPLKDSTWSPRMPSSSLESSSNLELRRQPRVVSLQSIPAAISSNLEERGLKFFFNRFATAVSAFQGSPYDIKSLSFLNAISLEVPLREAVVSVGLAALSNITKDRSLLLASREKHMGTINSVRLAVENPEQASPDQTFKLIVMLSLYEMVCCTAGQVDSWTVHFDGVAALIRQTSFGQALKASAARPQLQFYFVSIIKYFLTQDEIAPELLDWSLDSIPSSSSDQLPAIHLIDILIRFINLHSSKRQDPNSDPEATVAAALAFDAELAEWASFLPETWSFVVEESSDIENTFNGRYMVYKDVWASRDLNHYFWGRLVVNEMVLLHSSRRYPQTQNGYQQRERALDTISQMTTGICSGAASQMGVFGCGVPAGTMSSLSPLNGVFMLLFPLTIAGSAAGAPDEVHDWVVQRLRRIGSTMGIRRALELIPKVKELRKLNQLQYSYKNK